MLRCCSCWKLAQLVAGVGLVVLGSRVSGSRRCTLDVARRQSSSVTLKRAVEEGGEYVLNMLNTEGTTRSMRTCRLLTAH